MGKKRNKAIFHYLEFCPNCKLVEYSGTMFTICSYCGGGVGSIENKDEIQTLNYYHRKSKEWVK